MDAALHLQMRMGCTHAQRWVVTRPVWLPPGWWIVGVWLLCPSSPVGSPAICQSPLGQAEGVGRLRDPGLCARIVSLPQ